MISPDLLVLDGESRSTLGIIRNLARKGISIVVGCNSLGGKLSSYSRHVEHSFNYSVETGNYEAAHATILEQVKLLRPKVLMPVFNHGWFIVYNFYSEYEQLTKIVPNPGKDVFENLFDKSYLAETAESFGVPSPKTFRPESIDDAYAMKDDFPYPVLLKPRRDLGGQGIRRVENKQELDGVLEKYSECPIIQEVLDGEDLELTILCDHGEPIAGSVYLSLRNAPLPYGPPIACRSIKDGPLMELGINFLKGLQYHGVAHMDFRRDLRDGEPKLLDFNARLAGTNETSLVSGVDFSNMLYQLTLNESVDSVFEYALDREFRWLFSDLKYLLIAPHKLKTFRDMMRVRNVYTDISMSDPLPNLMVMFEAFRKIFKK